MSKVCMLCCIAKVKNFSFEEKNGQLYLQEKCFKSNMFTTAAPWIWLLEVKLTH